MARSSCLFQTTLPQSQTVEAILAYPLSQALVPSPSNGQVSDPGDQHMVLYDTTARTVVCQIQTGFAQSDSPGCPLVHQIWTQAVSSAKNA